MLEPHFVTRLRERLGVSLPRQEWNDFKRAALDPGKSFTIARHDSGLEQRGLRWGGVCIIALVNPVTSAVVTIFNPAGHRIRAAAGNAHERGTHRKNGKRKRQKRRL